MLESLGVRCIVIAPTNIEAYTVVGVVDQPVQMHDRQVLDRVVLENQR